MYFFLLTLYETSGKNTVWPNYMERKIGRKLNLNTILYIGILLHLIQAKWIKVIDSILKMFIYYLLSKQRGKYWPLKWKKTHKMAKKSQLQMFCHNKWNIFRQTFRQGGTMFDCFSWARKNAARESIMGSKYFWNFIIILYFFGSMSFQRKWKNDFTKG